MRNLALPFVLFAAAACGDDGPSKQVDAAVTGDDAQMDALSGDTARLTVTSNGAGIAGVRVHFQAPDSTLLGSVNTDANGVAIGPMTAGGYVTAVNPVTQPDAQNPRLYTYAGVQVGDELVITDDSAGAGIDVTITAPIDSDNNVSEYLFSMLCGQQTEASAGTGTATQSTIAVDSRCATSADILVATIDTAGELINWAYAPNVSTSSGTVDLSGSTLNAASTKTFTYNNVPAALGGLDFGTQFTSAKGRVVIAPTFSQSGTTLTQTQKLPPFTGATEIIQAEGISTVSGHLFLDWGPYSTSYTLDVGARMLKDATAGVTFDTGTRRATWTEAATGVVPDFAVADAQAFRATGSIYIDWSVVQAYGSGGQVQFPTLPVEGTDYNFASTDTVSADVSTGKLTGGFDAVRERFFAIDNVEAVTVGTATGSLTLQYIDAL